MTTTAIVENASEQTPTAPDLHNQTAKRLLDIHTLQDELTSSPYSHDVLELAMATVISVSFSRQEDTALVWLMIVSAPGSGKTNTTLLLKGAKEYVYCLDKLTENSFASGYIDKDTGRAPSLLPELDRKCLVVKDLSTMFNMRADKIRGILGDLLSIYDRQYSK